MRAHFALSAIALVCCSAAYAAVLSVPSQYPTIQAAIAAASNGDEIVVAPGSYTGTFDTAGKGITLRSSGGAAVTTLTSPLSSPVIRIQSGEGPDTVIEGFTIDDGGTTSGSGGGAFIQLADPAFVECVFKFNGFMAGVQGLRGSACHIVGGDPVFHDCAFLENAPGASGFPGGTVFVNGGTVEFVGSTFENYNYTSFYVDWCGGVRTV